MNRATGCRCSGIFRAYLHPPERHGQGRIPPDCRRTGPDHRLPRHQSARGPTCPTSPTTGSSVGAGFYLDATSRPSHKLPHGQLLLKELPASDRGGTSRRHGSPGRIRAFDGRATARSLSRFPIPAVSNPARPSLPSSIRWRQIGPRARSKNIWGSDTASWRAYDACALLEDGARFEGEILIDQGTADGFLDRSDALALRRGRQSRRSAGHAPHAGRVRSLLLLHLHLHGRSSALARGAGSDRFDNANQPSPQTARSRRRWRR